MDGNGLLVHFPAVGGGPPIEHQELTAWSMHFSGNSLSPAFDLTLDDLYGFIYEIGSAGVGDGLAFDPTLNQNLREGIGAIGATRTYESGIGPTSTIGGRIRGASQLLDSSPNLVLVTAVPEPSAAGLAVIGVVAACRGWRRASRNHSNWLTLRGRHRRSNEPQQ